MKRITLMMLSMLLTLTVSCQNASISNTADGTFTVNGSASFRNNGDTVWLVNSNGWIYLDSTLVKWGKFSLTGSSDTSFMATVMYGEDWDKLPLVVEPGMNVTLDLAKCTATGSPINEQLYLFVTPQENIDRELERLYESIHFGHPSNKKRAELEQQQKKVLAARLKLMDTTAWDIYTSNSDNAVGAYIFARLAQWALEFDKLYSDTVHSRWPRIDSAYSVASPIVKNNESVQYYMRFGHAQQNVSQGKQYTDIPALNYPTMQPVKLSQLIGGKVAVVDFWASWCGPCRKEITDVLIPLYQKHGGKDFVVVGVDVSDRIPEHEKASKQLGIPYPQIIDTTSFSSDHYGLQSIPQVFLIDRDGTLIGNYRGEELVREVEKALKKEDD